MRVRGSSYTSARIVQWQNANLVSWKSSVQIRLWASFHYEIMTKALYRFRQDFGRMGELNGVFIEDAERVIEVTEGDDEYMAHFGEVLGKHSDVYCELTCENVTFITDDDTTLQVVLDHDLQSGYNPFDYLEDEN